MPRRVLALLLAAALMLGLCGCAAESSDYPYSDYPYYDMEIQNDQVIVRYPMFHPGNLEELEECDLIVRGKLKDDGKAVPDWKGQGTEHSLHITKVYKGDLKKGATIPLRERYAVEKDGSKEKLVLYRAFMPAQVGKEYVFFLEQHDMAPVAPSYWTYYYDVFQRSRYPVISADGLSGDEISSLVDSMSYQDFQLHSVIDIDLYRELYKTVIQAYMQ